MSKEPKDGCRIGRSRSTTTCVMGVARGRVVDQFHAKTGFGTVDWLGHRRRRHPPAENISSTRAAGSGTAALALAPESASRCLAEICFPAIVVILADAGSVVVGERSSAAEVVTPDGVVGGVDDAIVVVVAGGSVVVGYSVTKMSM